MIHITLGRMRYVNPQEDQLGREHVGWDPNMGDEALFRANRGCWVLGERAEKEQYALLSCEGEVRMAIRIDSLVPVAGGRKAMEGRFLAPGDAVYDAYVGGKPPVESTRNPITYFDSPMTGACAAAAAVNRSPAAGSWPDTTRRPCTPESPRSAPSASSSIGSTTPTSSRLPSSRSARSPPYHRSAAPPALRSAIRRDAVGRLRPAGRHPAGRSAAQGQLGQGFGTVGRAARPMGVGGRGWPARSRRRT